jgi:hypothetical protein
LKLVGLLNPQLAEGSEITEPSKFNWLMVELMLKAL